MGKVLASDSEIKNGKVYAVTRLIHNYTSSDCEELVSRYSVDQLTHQIMQDKIDDRNVGPRTPRFRK